MLARREELDLLAGARIEKDDPLCPGVGDMAINNGDGESAIACANDAAGTHDAAAFVVDCQVRSCTEAENQRRVGREKTEEAPSLARERRQGHGDARAARHAVQTPRRHL
jgi:hypothetical protein